MRYWKKELKVYKLVDKKDEETGERYKVQEPMVLLEEDFDQERDSFRYDLEWRVALWTFALNRSLEIWEKLSSKKIEAGLGNLTPLSKRSLSGKLGAGNGKFFIKENDDWMHIKAKEYKYLPAFRLFSLEAIDICRNRARSKFNGLLNQS